MKECVNSLSIVYGVLVFFSYCLLEDEEEHNIDAPLFAYCYRYSITGPGLISDRLSHRFPMQKNAFEWGLSRIPHSEDAVQVTQHVANFFIRLGLVSYETLLFISCGFRQNHTYDPHFLGDHFSSNNLSSCVKFGMQD